VSRIPGHRLAALALLLALAALMLGRLWLKTPTTDEGDHLRYGLAVLHGDAERFDDSKMPVSALNALPARLAEELPAGSGLVRPLRSLLALRLATVGGTLLLALVVFAWASELYGPRGGLLALALTAFDPNLIAHGRLATTDLWAALAVALALWLTWRSLDPPSPRRRLLAAAAFGLAQLAKYTSLFLVALLPALVLVSRAPAALDALRRRRWGRLAGGTARGAGWAALFALAAVVAVNAGFLGRRTFTPLGDYAFRSQRLQGLQEAASPALAALPVPVPYPWLEGLDWVISRERREHGGTAFGNLYLFGERRRDRGFPHYYLWACVFKVPLPTQVLFLTALGLFVARRGPRRGWRDEIWLLGPALAFVYFSFFFRAQIGIRYLLVAFPLLHVFTGRLLAGPAPRGRTARGALAVALAWLALSVLSYFPHYLSYFNELIFDRTRAYRVLADSNLDWDQNVWWLERWLEEHPEAVLEPDGPTVGTLVVKVNFLTGVFVPERYRWLREHFEPVDHIAHSYLVYRIDEEDLRRLPACPAAE
jgi:4-amino-4-deoxy-L-arabinose transferase-like glycosyltransferase